MTSPDFTPTLPYRLSEITPGSFLYEIPHALTPDLCSEIIRRFEQSTDEQYPGRVGQRAEEQQSIKRSTDLVVSGKPLWQDIDTYLFRSLSAALKEFKKLFPFFSAGFKDMGYALQRTQAGEYYHWHIDGGSHEFSQRQLVAIWYLNDVPGPGGATEFKSQNIKVRPEQGKLLLFPPFWTHEHRGGILESGVKYIATTWVVFA